MTLGGFPTTKQEPIKEADKKSILVRASPNTDKY